MQGGLEIAIDVNVSWKNTNCMEILRSRLKEVGFKFDEEYKDESKSILQELLGDGTNIDNQSSDCEEL